MERAEALRNQQKQLKIQKAKDAQEKFLINEIAEKKRQIRSASQVIQQDLVQSDKQGSLSNRSQKPKSVAFYIDLDSSAKRWPNLVKAEEQKIAENNSKMSVPLNMDVQVKKNVQEKQTMEINEQRTMVVGGNKLTFNIAITVNVEPIE